MYLYVREKRGWRRGCVFVCAGEERVEKRVCICMCVYVCVGLGIGRWV